MLNFYYVYAATWGTILFLYLLGWSSLNAALNPVLLFFFLVTIILSLVLGMRWKKRFVYREIAPSKLPVWAIALILGCGVIGYAQLGFVPIANILNGTYVYQDISYLTSPLGNLNYSLNTAIQVDPVNFCYDFLPIMLSKRLPLYEVVEPPLQVPYFNVSSVWSNYYMHLDLMGLFLGYLLQVCMLEVWIKLARGSEYEGLMMAYCSQCVILSFFVNSFAYPTMGYPAILLACICIWKRSSKRKSYARAAPLCLCRHV